MNAPAIVDRPWLGGSDISGVLGVSPWGATPVTVWMDKTGAWPDGKPAIDPQKQKSYARGKRLEPVVRDMAKDEYGLKVVKISHPHRPNRYIDSQVPFFAAEIDFEAIVTASLHEAWPELGDIPVGTRVNCEIKTTLNNFTADKMFGENHTDEVDMGYAAQCEWGLGVTGRKHCLLFASIGAQTLLAYRIDRDDGLIAMMRAKALQFWHEHVIPRVPPDPVRWEDVNLLLPREKSIAIDADDELQAKLVALAEAKRMQQDGEEAEKLLKLEIGKYVLGEQLMAQPAEIAKHVIRVGGEPALTIGFQKQSRIDSKRLAEECPEIAERFQRESRFFTFRKATKRKAA